MIEKKRTLFTIGLAITTYCLCAQERSIDEMRNSTQAIMSASIDRENASILQQLDSIKFVNIGEKDAQSIVFDIEDVNVVRKLNSLEREVPLDYNQHVRKYIDLYNSKNYSGHMSRMLGLAQYYFPLYERILAEVGVPKEIKYLSIIESALNPHDVSRVGATGPWQFMYGTAKIYNLTMDTYVDERKDPIASSYAAAKYMKEAYAEFGDWLLAIASYNCGKGGVKRAILRSGKIQPTFWEVAPYLPKETRNYIPAYIAMTYTLGYAQEHGIEAQESEIALNTQVLEVDKFISIAEVAKAINVSEESLKLLNPAYKKGVVNGSDEIHRRLIIPALGDGINKDQLYIALNTTVEAPVQSIAAVDADIRKNSKGSAQPSRHQVRRGETLAIIARKYDVSVQNLKAWNNVSGSSVKAGTSLVVNSNGINSRLAQKATASSSKKSTVLVYTVKKGDTLSEIANNKGVSLSKLKADNNLSHTKLKPGMKLKINKG
ncbi:lytic transglycosylase domain-containing protein [Sphingobacterium faecium]|jgi:membrane-bound lytic murein transglycosylase D|uniref:lytic transglycosylase domain-containing protein n=1 Tax=Sphingobacterium faecium TaxID=34087 RepID=UPI0004E5FA73|nr:lytic transglycosylase domain-containing protein [Sphingobacterium faecium]UXD69942.1 LysM peptidoglycan-binding domain-containing protein [Sphingobacterium faecium]WGQ13490.1 LysM peptidoglycan-binding domain-containing protein [Sphingobacterium faecium]CDS92458.1 putative lytic murein transglycosylase [Sphingobacterium sp. PM2-P1-29]HCU46112.1 lytic transglycosylase [Sphingobacterium sp.]